MRYFSIICFFFLTLTAFGQDGEVSNYFDSDLKLAKKEIVSEAITINEEEEADFWALYVEFNQKLDSIGKNWIELLNKAQEQAGSDNNDRADFIWKELNTYVTARQSTFDTYYDKFKQVIPASETFTYFMIEKKIDAEVNGEVIQELDITIEE